MIYTCVKRSTTRIVSFCSRKKRFFLQVLYSICILMQMMYLLFAIWLRLWAVTESLCLNDEGKYFETESGCFTVPRRDHQKCAYITVFDITCCPRNPWVIAWGEGEGINWLIYIRTPWSSFVPRKTSLVVSTKKKKNSKRIECAKKKIS